jgi:hypothetical protein
VVFVMAFAVGDRVDRIEVRDMTGAVVLAVEDGDEEPVLELSYDEGGTGWWPAGAIRAADDN